MSTESPIPPLFRALVDDAALFPPGDAPMSVAVAEHRHHRAAPYGELVGPLLIPTVRWGELVDRLDAGPEPPAPLDIGLIGPIEELTSAAGAALAEPRVALRQLECPVTDAELAADAGLVGAVAGRLGAVADETVRAYVELPRGPRLLAAVDALAAAGAPVGAKLRTGGSTAAAFPGEAELAGFLDRCAARDQPFKLTAGLHHAVRHTDPATGFEQHGYLNVLAAACLGRLSDPPLPGTAAALAVREPGPLVEVVAALLDEPRPGLASYGSCSVAEPLTDLVELRLLDSALPSHLPAPREATA